MADAVTHSAKIRSSTTTAVSDAPDRRGLWILLGVLLACLIPFLNKPVHIDDPLFIWVGQRIQQHAWDFYGGTINWYGMPMRVYQIVMNPPLTSYFLAAAAALAGWNEPALHTAMLIPTLATAAGIYQLARRFCARPALATAMAVLSPAFLVSATTLMSDVPMLCLWVWATVAWTAGVRENRQGLLLTGSLLILAAALAKYFAACLIPLLILDAVVVWRGLRWGLLWLALPVAGLFGYQAYTAHLYGSGLLGAAVTYSMAERARELGSSRPRVLTGMSFMGGCLLTVVPAATLACLRWLRECKPARRWIVVAAAGAVLLGLFAFDLPVITRYVGRQHLPPAELIQLILFSTASLPLLATAIAALRHPLLPDSLLLGCWILGTFIFVVGFNWTVNARTILPMTPAAAILAVRHLPIRGHLGWVWGCVVALATVSLSAAYADQALARSSRDGSTYVCQQSQRFAGTVWFEGHWGFRYYMQQWGAKPLDATRTRCLPGQMLVVAGFNVNPVAVPPGAVRLIERFSLPQARWIGTMAPDLGAGFYSDVCGPLPFAFGWHQTDTYDALAVIKSIQYSQASPD